MCGYLIQPNSLLSDSCSSVPITQSGLLHCTDRSETACHLFCFEARPPRIRDFHPLGLSQKKSIIFTIQGTPSSRCPRQKLTGYTSHTTERTGLVLGGSPPISTIALYTNGSYFLLQKKAIFPLHYTVLRVKYSSFNFRKDDVQSFIIPSPSSLPTTWSVIENRFGITTMTSADFLVSSKTKLDQDLPR